MSMVLAYDATVDGQERYGVWGKPGSGAPNTDARLTGDGYICGKGGLAVVIR